MATVTLNIPAAVLLRLQTVVGKHRNLVDENGDPRLATGAEVKAQFISNVKSYLRHHERLALQEAVAEPENVEIT